MYDDWDLDYTYTPNYESYDLDEIYESTWNHSHRMKN